MKFGGLGIGAILFHASELGGTSTLYHLLKLGGQEVFSSRVLPLLTSILYMAGLAKYKKLLLKLLVTVVCFSKMQFNKPQKVNTMKSMS